MITNTNSFSPMGLMGGFSPFQPMMGNPMMTLQAMMSMLAQMLTSMQGQTGFPMMPGFGGSPSGSMDMGVGSFLGSPGGMGGGRPMGGMASGNTGYPSPSTVAGAGPGRAQDGGGSSSVDLARQFLGRPSRSIRGEMPNFTAAGGNTNNCADFVSSALESTGGVRGHDVNCRALERRLRQQGWQQVPRGEARAGDVAFYPNRRHVQLVSGENTQIGSNNNGRRGFQTISEGRLRGDAVIYRRA